MVTAATLAGVLGLQALKLVRHRNEVMAKLAHPVRIAFLPTIAIGDLLLAIAVLAVGTGETATMVARGAWLVGTATLFLFTLAILSRWMHHLTSRVVPVALGDASGRAGRYVRTAR